MLTYDMSISRRQYDGMWAVWALMPDPTLSPEDRATLKVSSFPSAPKTMTPPLRWVLIDVCGDESEARRTTHMHIKH